MESDISFGFNNAKFSDRLLRIEITGDGGDGEVSCSTIADRVRDRKRRRLDCNNVSDLAVKSDLNKKHEEASKSGYEDEKLATTNPLLVRVKELHISSLILAAKSPFFFKLFSNGMLESEQRDVTLCIDATEEAAVMEVLKFMYTNSLSVTTAPALLNVLIAADKYEVASCIKYCSRLLLDMPMTVDSALLLLDLPSSVVATDSAKPLTIAARQFLASYYKDIFKFPVEEVVALPLVGIEAILASDDLEIRSEDILYDVVLQWAKEHYPDLEERQEIFGSHLARYIRFPHMTCGKLAEIMTSNDFKPAVASNIVLEALLFKAESNHGRHRLAAQQPVSHYPRFVERAYKYRPIQFTEFEIPRHQCIVYLDLTRKECAGLYPVGQLSSQVFPLGGLGFVLYAQCNMDQSSSFHCFGLFLGLGERQPVSPTVNYKFSARSKPTTEFVGKFKAHRQFAGGMLAGKRNLFAIPWESFMSNDCPYFINDVLHLRARLSIRH